MIISELDSEFLRYLVTQDWRLGDRLPSLEAIGAEIGLGVGKLREQFEVARMLGLVEASPRRGIRYLGYEFLPAVRLSLLVGLALDRSAFDAFSALRIHLEAAFWDEAVALLNDDDKAGLRDLVAQAYRKLNHGRVQIPHAEHRQFHLAIYRRLGNPFVLGLLEAYWDAYEAVEYNTYADYGYLQEVWGYHERIAEAICAGQFASGKELLTQHMQLLDRLGVSHEFPVSADAPVEQFQGEAA